MDYFYKKEAFSKPLLKSIMDFCLKEDFLKINYSKDFGRFSKNIYFTEEIEKQIEEEANLAFGLNNLKIVYNSLTKYQIVDGGMPKLDIHKDNLPCTHIIDLTIDTTLPEWGLICENDFYKDLPGGAVFFEGSKVHHGRPIYPSNNELDYSKLLFINLATPGHWGLVAKEKLGKLERKLNFFPTRSDTRRSWQTDLNYI